ncbi:hypothetical protein Pelo_14828 [Pelomyxa schiedti]|nr:hypothetical protein Pelo_14828 [Pelomyxa schiedti]
MGARRRIAVGTDFPNQARIWEDCVGLAFAEETGTGGSDWVGRPRLRRGFELESRRVPAHRGFGNWEGEGPAGGTLSATEDKAVELWQIPLPMQGERVVSRVTMTEGEKLVWMDLMSGNQACVSVKKGEERNFLWLVDLEKTHKLGVFSVTQEFKLDTVCKGVYLSFKHGIIVRQMYCDAQSGNNDHVLMQLCTNKVMRRCSSKPIKVDTFHFFEGRYFFPGESVPAFYVFSTEDFEHPCCIIPEDFLGTVSRIANGHPNWPLFVVPASAPALPGSVQQKFSLVPPILMTTQSHVSTTAPWAQGEPFTSLLL